MLREREEGIGMSPKPSTTISPHSTTSLLQRYRHAVELTGPRVAATTPGIAVDGYWLDDNRFYFLAEELEPSTGRVVVVPSIADCKAGGVASAISRGALAALLSGQRRQPVDLPALSSAEFDMPAAETLALSVEGHDYLIDLKRQRVIEAGQSLQVPALYSSDGRWACFVKGYDLWLHQRDAKVERPLTTDGARHARYAQQSETSMAAVVSRRCPTPVGLWSPDSQWFLTHRIEEQALPELALVQHAPPGRGRPLLHRFKYPIPGDPLPVGTYVAIHVTSGRIVRFEDFPWTVAAYSPFSARTVWFSGPNEVSFVRCDRYSRQAALIRLDLTRGTGRIVLSETVESGYIDVHPVMAATPNVRTLERSDEVVWFSERDGWGHLYLYDGATGAMKNRITCGRWLVRDIVHVDEEHRKVLFLAGGIDPDTDPARRCLCSVNLDGSDFAVLLTHEGDVFLPPTEPCGLGQHRAFRPANGRAGVSPDGRFGVVRYASVDRGNRTEIVELQTRRGFAIASAQLDSDEVPPRHFTATAAEGMTPLYGVMFLPSDFDPRRRYPLIDYIYPGPQIAQQPQSFRAANSALARALAELGFVAIMLDSRGTPIGSRAFHQAGYPELLEPQLSDHAAVVRQLCARFPFIDAGRIGILGYSAGGAAAVRALCDYGEIFSVGIAACGYNDASLGPAMWSDKYRGPQERERWAHEAIGAVVHKLQGKLLLIAGDMDESVPISQTLSLVDALIRANKDFDLLIVPNAGHTVLLDNGYVQRRVWDYFVRHLRGETPPQNFELKFEPHELDRFRTAIMREARQ